MKNNALGIMLITLLWIAIATAFFTLGIVFASRDVHLWDILTIILFVTSLSYGLISALVITHLLTSKSESGSKLESDSNSNPE